MKNRIINSALIIFLVVGYLLYQNGVFGLDQFVPRKYPELQNPKVATLNCNYHGSNLKIEETLYGSVYDYYKTDPKKKRYFYKDDNKDFVFSYEEDKTISDITDKIEAAAQKKGLNSDQTLDLAACFLQNIPYDEVKAKKILSPEFKKYPVAEIIPRFPYETLYDNTGICTDKSYLGAAIFKELGYGTALLSFDKERHLSIGVNVPDIYNQNGTNYAIMELTGMGFLVGDTPIINPSLGLAQNSIDNLPQISNDNLNSDNTSNEISKASKVEVISDGKEYKRIQERANLRAQIESTKKTLEAKKIEVVSAQSQLKTEETAVKEAENYYKQNPSRINYDAYLSVYNNYQTVYSQTKTTISSYNSIVGNFNSLVEKYKNY